LSVAGVGSDKPQEGSADTVPAKDETQPSQQEPRRSSPTLPPPPGQERYQIGSELGRGGMGRVVEAFDVQLGRTVALKEVLPKAGSASARRFEREVALTAKLEHPSIVPLYDSGTTQDGRPYYVMRRVSGRPLDELLQRSRKLDDRLALLPAVQSAIDAVAHAHRRGVIHRDLKPANILVGDLGETVVIDWGLAKVVGEDDELSSDSLPSDSLQTQIGSVFGTPGFMAPEQARGDEMGTGGDVYALGATLYQLLSGQPPHAGPSATAVIEKTLKSQMVPLSEIAPGAPVELVTIVNKALSPEPEQRYPHAGALGEDLRRFLTGQLVAAHQYTAVERIVRFAKRHRGALAVGVLAIVALSILAIVSVKRIVRERDAANAARAEAVAGKQAAEKANKELAIRHDALLVSKARARIDLNPTEALATLKHLPATSTQLDEARAVAQAATLRGVTWAMQSTLELTVIAEMSTDTRQLLQVSRDGMVRVWDLERKRLDLARPFPAMTRALWIADGKLLVTHESSAPAVLEPGTNTLENTTVPPIAFALASARGDRVVFYGPSGAGTFDAKTRTVTMFTTEKASEVHIAPDGTAMSYTIAKETVIVDAAGAVIAKLPPAARVEFSPAGYVAALVDTKILELRLGVPKPAFVPIQPPDEKANLIIDILYQDRELVMMTGRIAFWSWNGERTYQRGTMTSLNAGMKLADNKYIMLMSSDNKVHFLERSSKGTVQLPANLLHPRLVTRASSTKVMVVADGMILGFDLDTLRPRLIDVRPDAEAVFVGDDTLLTGHMVSRNWEWIDLETGKRSAIDLDVSGPVMGIDVDPAGRALVAELGPRGTRVHLLTRGSAEAKLIVEGAGAWARLVPGNAIIYTTGDPKIMAIVDGAAPREVAKVAGVPDGGAPTGHLKVAVHSTEGELVRIDLGTNAVERTTIALGSSFLMEAEPATGKVVLAEDNRILLWDGQVTQIASFDKPVVQLAMLQNAVAATLRDNETFLVELRPNKPPIRVFPPGRSGSRSSSDGRVMVAVGNAEQIDVLELPQRTRWTIPQYYQWFPSSALQVSPTRRRVLQHAMHSLVVWQLPLAPSQDFAQWLDEQTNATVDATGELLWPWQAPNP
jgi:Protein kinase domain